MLGAAGRSTSKIALKLSGRDASGAEIERVLIVLADDIHYGDLAWGLKQLDR